MGRTNYRQSIGRGGGRDGTNGGRGYGGRNNRDRRDRRKQNNAEKEDGNKRHRKMFRTMDENNNSSDTFKSVCTDLENAIGNDRMFQDVTSDAQYIVRELDLPVDKKNPPVLIVLTDKDEPNENMRKAKQASLQQALNYQLKTWHEKIQKMPDVKAQIRAKILKDFCSTDMMNELEKETDYTTVLKCPIELLKRIRQLMESGSSRCHEITLYWPTS